ncbi:retron St85 family effector protein [Methylomonas albis]|uniref:Uncharacterized protein n=1 Tax=Methylomonas albis TaxID=1854563 RepID=A0ABR9D2V4_9GAMM|nr:retron St85 family effector protein [Methylomonas albis]MBD9357449.1 hypothetical protein [Methylomonas albis]
MEGSEVLLTPPIIFACGGNTDVRLPEPESVRGYFIQHVASKEPQLSPYIQLAENFKDWLHDSKYSDLKTFEEDLAHISSLILLFLESPGTIAELGLFSTNINLIKKLVIFVGADHFGNDSFINLGPLRYIEQKNQEAIYSYPWKDKDIKNTVKNHLVNISQDVKDLLEKKHKKEFFDKNNPGHIAFLVFEIVLIFKALKYSEIFNFLACLELSISKPKLTRLLFLLEKLELISKKRYGGSDFYFPIQKNSRVSLSLKDKDNKIDRLTLTMAAMQFYTQDPNERHRQTMLGSLFVKEETGVRL